MDRRNRYNARNDYSNPRRHQDQRSKPYSWFVNQNYDRNRNVNSNQNRSNIYRYNRDPYTSGTGSNEHFSSVPSNFRTRECMEFKSRERGTYSHSHGESNFIHPTTRDPPQLLPEEIKVSKLIDAVRSQDGITGFLVLMRTERDNPITILQNAIQNIKNGVLSVVVGNNWQQYELKLNGEVFATGDFPNKQAAKNALCEIVLGKLEKTCFSIIKKNNYEEISTEDINKSKINETPSNTMEGSKAHLMMLKMGWGGKGLGANEQGAEKTVAETMTKNITKEGLGGKNVMGEINNILKEFALSAKVTTLAFDSSFTKEERAQIHSLAARLNLKSKSEGKGDDRRITIGKKIERWDLVRELLLNDCENDAYKLLIPSNFKNMWTVE